MLCPLPRIRCHSPGSVVEEQSAVARAQRRFALRCNPDPAVPVLASDEIRVLVETVLQEQGPLDVYARAGQRVSFSECLSDLPSGADNRFVDRDPRFIDDPYQLEKEPALGIGFRKVFSTVERTRSQLVVRVQENQKPSACRPGAPVPRVRPLAVLFIYEHPKV